MHDYELRACSVSDHHPVYCPYLFGILSMICAQSAVKGGQIAQSKICKCILLLPNKIISAVIISKSINIRPTCMRKGSAHQLRLVSLI